LCGTFLSAECFLFVVSVNLDLRDNVSARGEFEATFIVYTIFIKLGKLLKHGLNVDDDPVTEQVLAGWIEYTARKQVERIFMSISHDSVSSVGATVEASADVIVFSENVNKFAFAFVAPLGAEHDSELRFKASEAARVVLSNRLGEAHSDFLKI